MKENKSEIGQFSHVALFLKCVWQITTQLSLFIRIMWSEILETYNTWDLKRRKQIWLWRVVLGMPLQTEYYKCKLGTFKLLPLTIESTRRERIVAHWSFQKTTRSWLSSNQNVMISQFLVLFNNDKIVHTVVLF